LPILTVNFEPYPYPAPDSSVLRAMPGWEVACYLTSGLTASKVQVYAVRLLRLFQSGGWDVDDGTEALMVIQQHMSTHFFSNKQSLVNRMVSNSNRQPVLCGVAFHHWSSVGCSECRGCDAGRGPLVNTSSLVDFAHVMVPVYAPYGTLNGLWWCKDLWTKICWSNQMLWFSCNIQSCTHTWLATTIIIDQCPSSETCKGLNYGNWIVSLISLLGNCWNTVAPCNWWNHCSLMSLMGNLWIHCSLYVGFASVHL